MNFTFNYQDFDGLPYQLDKIRVKFGTFYAGNYLKRLMNPDKRNRYTLDDLLLRIIYGLSNIKQFTPTSVFDRYFVFNREHTKLIFPATSAALTLPDTIKFINCLLRSLNVSADDLISNPYSRKQFTNKIRKKHNVPTFGEFARRIGYKIPGSFSYDSRLVDSNNVALGIPQTPDKRTKLAKLNDGKKHSFIANFIRLGKKSHYIPSLLRPVLLRKIYYKGQLITDHAWVSDMPVHKLKSGQKISFKAKVYVYMKDFNSNNIHDTSFATDYGLQDASNIKVVK